MSKKHIDDELCFCPVKEFCQMPNNSSNQVRRLEGDSEYCMMNLSSKESVRCYRKAATLCLMAQFKDPSSNFWCRVCDFDSGSVANLENLKVTIPNVETDINEDFELTKSPIQAQSSSIIHNNKFVDLTTAPDDEEIESSISNNNDNNMSLLLSKDFVDSDDPRDHCNCPVRLLCLLTAENVGIMKTSNHFCTTCRKRVYGPCLGEQLDNPMAVFWCRTCDDVSLNLNGANVRKEVREMLNSSMIQTNSEAMVIDDNNDNKQSQIVLERDDVKACKYNDEKSWAECIICRQTQFSSSLNKAGICAECLEVEKETKMKSMMDYSDDSSCSDNDDAKSIKKLTKAPPKNGRKDTSSLPLSTQNEPTPFQSSQQSNDNDDSFFNQKSDSVDPFSATKSVDPFSATKTLMFSSSGDENGTPFIDTSNDKNFNDKSSFDKSKQFQNESSDNTYEESSSDDCRQTQNYKLPQKESYYSLDMFSAMEFPYDIDPSNNSSASPHRRNFVLLASTVYGQEFCDEMDRINHLNVCDKYADGIKYMDKSDDFNKTYSQLSKTAPDLFKNKTLTFPLRLWSGERLKSEVVIILGLHLTSTIRRACAIYPITCGTNRFGLWNQDKTLKKSSTVISGYWTFRSVEEVDREFTAEQIETFKTLLSDYWKNIHGENPNSINNLKSKFNKLQYNLILSISNK